MYRMLPSNNNTLCLKGLAYLLCLPANLLLSVLQCLGCFRQTLWVPVLIRTKRCVPGFENHYAEYSRSYILREFLVSKIGDFAPLKAHLVRVLGFCTSRMVTGIVSHRISFKLSWQKALILLFRGRSKPNETGGKFRTVPSPLQIYALKV